MAEIKKGNKRHTMVDITLYNLCVYFLKCININENYIIFNKVRAYIRQTKKL
jgi:hypothetical protein